VDVAPQGAEVPPTLEIGPAPEARPVAEEEGRRRKRRK
jgi:hypothetical protein